MHLRSIALKGFKSFPDRTRLDFRPGISVIVGPNGSGKSNITDAVLWALGEQSPLAVRGQTMQDVVFAGGHGVRGRDAAEVEVVIDNSDGGLDSEFSEIAISRRIDRSGEGTYRLNGARCRLVDVLEVLSDSGLGKEMHSVISQGRVEAIVHSKAVDRTAMIEEAAGLTKHRKRRHRAQLKLRRTQDNLDRALDVEREARSRLRPLKRQAEAAELHARLERQVLETRGTLVGEALRAARAAMAEAERIATEARTRRDGVDGELLAVARRREQVEAAFTDQGRERELLSAHLFAVRSSADRIGVRLESAEQVLAGTRARLERARRALEAMGAQDATDTGPGTGPSRVAALEAELERVERERAARVGEEVAGIEAEAAAAEQRAAAIGERIEAIDARAEERRAAHAAAAGRRRDAAGQAEAAARRHAKLTVELGAVEDRLRLSGAAEVGGPALADSIEVERGYEAAVAAALGGRLRARVVTSLAEGAGVVEAAPEGGRALICDEGRGETGAGEAEASAEGVATAGSRGVSVAGAERLLDRVRPAGPAAPLVDRLLADAWVVPALDGLPSGFRGVAVTREGTLFDGGAGEVRRLPAGAAGRALADRNRRAELTGEIAAAAGERTGAETAAERAAAACQEIERESEALDAEARELRRGRAEAQEEARRAQWLAAQRRESGAVPQDAEHAGLVAEIAAERRLAERLERERAERVERRRGLEALIAHDDGLAPVAEGLLGALERARTTVAARLGAVEREMAAGENAGEEVAAELRRLSRREYELQAALREAAEAVTQEEVRLAHDADREQALASEAGGIAERLGVEHEPAAEPLAADEREQLEARLERLDRRRERLGPVNPLAEREYEEAVAHVEELESQRGDLDAALAELRGLIRETDRRIREAFEETFEAAARNFEEVIGRLFPGGGGRLRRVSAPRPRTVLGGEGAQAEEGGEAGAAPFAGTGADAAQTDAGEGGDGPADAAGAQAGTAEAGDAFAPDTPGIEIEVTPAGKTTRRLSLLSGGEKSLVALAFMFAVFLARPCPFYILDEVEAALDDANIGRFLEIVRSYSDRAQFIIITHQRRTMEAADVLYGVSMGKDGISKVVSRRLASQDGEEAAEGSSGAEGDASGPAEAGAPGSVLGRAA